MEMLQAIVSNMYWINSDVMESYNYILLLLLLLLLLLSRLD